MKKLYACLLCAPLYAFALNLNLNAQEIPKGSYCAMPRLLNGTNVDMVCVVWDGTTYFTAEFGANADAVEMYYHKENGGGHAAYPTGDAAFKAEDVNGWLSLAKEVRGQFRAISDDAYAETTPYEYLGQSFGLDSFEHCWELSSLVFKKGTRLLAIPMNLWKGKVPPAGTKEVYIGRTVFNNYFFLTKKVGAEYFVDLATAKELVSPSPEK